MHNVGQERATYKLRPFLLFSIKHGRFPNGLFSQITPRFSSAVDIDPKEIEIILRLFRVIAMYCQGSSSQIKALTQPFPLLAGLEGSLGSNSLETTYILFELP